MAATHGGKLSHDDSARLEGLFVPEHNDTSTSSESNYTGITGGAYAYEKVGPPDGFQSNRTEVKGFWEGGHPSQAIPTVVVPALFFICVFTFFHTHRQRRLGRTRMCCGLVRVSPMTVQPAPSGDRLKLEKIALAAIDALPSAPWHCTEAEVECEICLSPLLEGELVTRLPRCAHAFHHRCLHRWLVEGQRFKRRRCPLCNSDPLVQTTAADVPLAESLISEPATEETRAGLMDAASASAQLPSPPPSAPGDSTAGTSRRAPRGMWRIGDLLTV